MFGQRSSKESLDVGIDGPQSVLYRAGDAIGWSDGAHEDRHPTARLLRERQIHVSLPFFTERAVLAVSCDANDDAGNESADPFVTNPGRRGGLEPQPAP